MSTKYKKANSDKERSIGTKLIDSLITICFIPITKESDGSCSFSFLSWKFFLFCILYVPLPMMIIIIAAIPLHENYYQMLLNLLSMNNLIDSYVILTYMVLVLLGCTGVIIIINTKFPKFNCITPLYVNFLMPLNIRCSIVSYVLFNVGFFTFTLGMVLGNIPVEVPFIEKVAMILVQNLGLGLAFAYWFYATIIVSAWLTQFIVTCEAAAHELLTVDDTMKKIKKVLTIYKYLEKNLGHYFAFSFTMFQINWIMIIYSGITSYFANYDFLYLGLFGTGSIITSIGGKKSEIFSPNLYLASASKRSSN